MLLADCDRLARIVRQINALRPDLVLIAGDLVSFYVTFAIVSLAASDASEVPRGMDFLIMRNRINVAVSRAQGLCGVCPMVCVNGVA